MPNQEESVYENSASEKGTAGLHIMSDELKNGRAEIDAKADALDSFCRENTLDIRQVKTCMKTVERLMTDMKTDYDRRIENVQKGEVILNEKIAQADGNALLERDSLNYFLNLKESDEFAAQYDGRLRVCNENLPEVEQFLDFSKRKYNVSDEVSNSYKTLSTLSNLCSVQNIHNYRDFFREPDTKQVFTHALAQVNANGLKDTAEYERSLNEMPCGMLIQHMNDIRNECMNTISEFKASNRDADEYEKAAKSWERGYKARMGLESEKEANDRYLLENRDKLKKTITFSGKADNAESIVTSIEKADRSTVKRLDLKSKAGKAAEKVNGIINANPALAKLNNKIEANRQIADRTENTIRKVNDFYEFALKRASNMEDEIDTLEASFSEKLKNYSEKAQQADGNNEELEQLRNTVESVSAPSKEKMLDGQPMGLIKMMEKLLQKRVADPVTDLAKKTKKIEKELESPEIKTPVMKNPVFNPMIN